MINMQNNLDRMHEYLVMVKLQPLGRPVDCLNWIDGGLQSVESHVFGCHSVRLRQSDSLLSFGNSFELSLFVIRHELVKISKTVKTDKIKVKVKKSFSI